MQPLIRLTLREDTQTEEEEEVWSEKQELKLQGQLMVNFKCQVGWTTLLKYFLQHYSGYFCEGVVGWHSCLNQWSSSKADHHNVCGPRPITWILNRTKDWPLPSMREFCQPTAFRLNCNSSLVFRPHISLWGLNVCQIFTDFVVLFFFWDRENWLDIFSKEAMWLDHSVLSWFSYILTWLTRECLVGKRSRASSNCSEQMP